MLGNNLPQILNVVLIISCVVHVMFIFYNNSNPANPEIIVENKNIMDVSMPLSFIFCLRNKNDESENEKYQQAGYKSTYRFFSGTSMFNQSVVGWHGHMKNGSTYDSLEGIFIIHTLSKIKDQTSNVLEIFSMLKLEEVYLKTVKELSIDSTHNKTISYDLETYFGRNSPPLIPNCRLVELNTTGVPKRIIINLWKTENVSFHMNIVEKNMASRNRLQSSFAYNGPFLGIDNLHEASYVAFGLRVKQSSYSDQDVETNCVEYPTKNFKSFRDCDEDFVLREMQKIGVIPFWAIKGNNNATKTK